MAEIQKVIGLMSGTSLDGVDAALLETDGEDVARPRPRPDLPYNDETRALLRAALDEARGVAQARRCRISIREAERRLTEAHAEAVKALLAKAGLRRGQVALIGFHGQTILHRPERHWTWQIGDGALLARLTGIDVVNDFRSADVKAGGQGAPLMPLYHAVLARQVRAGAEPVVVVNIGGVAKVTYISGDTVLAFDTGPGNAPDRRLDAPAQRQAGGRGRRLCRAPAGSTTRRWTKCWPTLSSSACRPNRWTGWISACEAVEGLSPADGAATLTAFTAASLARAREHFPEPAATWIVSGGGRHNKTLMAMLKARVNAPVLVGGRCRLGRRCDGSRRLRLSGDAFEKGLAAVAADDDGRQAADDGRQILEGVTRASTGSMRNERHPSSSQVRC